LPREIELVPRMWMIPAVPVVFPGRIVTPGALATRRSVAEVMGVSSTRLLMFPSVAILLPSSTRRCWPVAVVTTSWSCTATVRISKSSVACCPSVTVMGFFCSW
jgi:hypothetical protein